jgi:hypothetical protein
VTPSAARNVNAPIAQLVEQLPLKEMVRGSNPRGGTTNIRMRPKEPTASLREGSLGRILMFVFVIGIEGERVIRKKCGRCLPEN